MPPTPDPASLALKKCEAIMHKLGAQMTFGGEVEWYMIPNTKFSEPLEVTRNKLFEELNKNPSALIGMEGLNLTIHSINNVQRNIKRSEGIDLSREEAMIRMVQERFSDNVFDDVRSNILLGEQYISEQMRLFTIIAKTYHECADAGIGLNPDFKREAGNISSGTMDAIVSIKQYEISTAVANAPTTAVWLDEMRKILARNSKEYGFEADFRDKPPYTLAMGNAGNGMHIHYGLVALDDNKINLMRHGEKSGSFNNTSATYHACVDGVTEMLHQGGVALCCVSDNAYKRNQGVYTIRTNSEGLTDEHAVERAYCGEELHQEDRKSVV